ncbi:MAG: glycosyltransferase family 4 protein [Bacteroidota bacterium]|nr:glycosyltransferase family 4 protein [Bacteroidota bacterium]
MKTILASAYAVNPYKGSEDGMGWNFIYQIARYNKVIAITRKNNKSSIEEYMHENPDFIYENITFYYFDLPKWAMFWKKGSRGALLYFYLWQWVLPIFVKKQKLIFDITHNVNFHNDWTPSFLWKLNKPFVWGPVGHHPPIHSQFLKEYKKKYLVKEKLTLFIKYCFWNMSFSLRKTKSKASHIFCMNRSVPKVLNLSAEKYSITPSVATQDFGCNLMDKEDKFTLISAGRLVPLKGFDLTIKSFAAFLNRQPKQAIANCELIIVGSGPELKNYVQLTEKLNVKNNVKFINWIDRKELLALFKRSSAFIFPSHEGAGMVVAEALSFGLPVLCLDNCGPGEFITPKCGIAVTTKNYSQTINELSTAISRLFNSPYLLREMSKNARTQFEKRFHWDVRGEEFRKVYLNI